MKKRFFIAVILLVLIIVSGTAISIKKNSFVDQNAAKRWSEERMEQISVFYPVTRTKDIDSFFFTELSHRIQTSLDKSAFANTSGITDLNGISFPYSVSVTGRVTIEYEGKKAETTAIGIEERFFNFHPVDLIYGSYISANDLMQDGIVIDDAIAWNLFGSSDVIGKVVTIGDVPHYIKGVTQKKDDRISKEAGLESSLCYISLDSMKKYGQCDGSFCYEVILPDPVDDFATNLMGETLGDEAKKLEVVDNTHRYSRSNCLKKIGQIGIRSMSFKDIIFPYYENEARAWEDILAIWYGVQTLLLCGLIIDVFLIYISFRRMEQYKRIKRKLRLSNIFEKIKKLLERKAASGNKEEKALSEEELI